MRYKSYYLDLNDIITLLSTCIKCSNACENQKFWDQTVWTWHQDLISRWFRFRKLWGWACMDLSYLSRTSHMMLDHWSQIELWVIYSRSILISLLLKAFLNNEAGSPLALGITVTMVQFRETDHGRHGRKGGYTRKTYKTSIKYDLAVDHQDDNLHFGWMFSYEIKQKTFCLAIIFIESGAFKLKNTISIVKHGSGSIMSWFYWKGGKETCGQKSNVIRIITYWTSHHKY